MKDILNRIKSPVVIAQLVTILGSLFVTIFPDKKSLVDEIVYAITVIVNIFSGLNNPTDKKGF